MHKQDLLVLIHNALHAGSLEVAIPGRSRVLTINEYPFSGVRAVIVTDSDGVCHEFMTQNREEQSDAGVLARHGISITRERLRINGKPYPFTTVGVVNGKFTFRIEDMIHKELDRITLVA